jgi:hypothetical protein
LIALPNVDTKKREANGGTNMQEQGTMERREPIQNRDSDAFMTEETSDYPPGQAEPMERERENTEELQDPNETRTAMFETQETEDFRSRWLRIQTEFIDDPRRSVERANELVAETMNRLTEIFAQERERLEQEWDRGDNVSTEDLRLALRRYRSFFDRLLSV